MEKPLKHTVIRPTPQGKDNKLGQLIQLLQRRSPWLWRSNSFLFFYTFWKSTIWSDIVCVDTMCEYSLLSSSWWHNGVIRSATEFRSLTPLNLLPNSCLIFIWNYSVHEMRNQESFFLLPRENKGRFCVFRESFNTDSNFKFFIISTQCLIQARLDSLYVTVC